MPLLILLLLELIRFHTTVGQQLVNNYVCTDAYCERFLETSSCNALDIPCLAQNVTLNGIVLPSQTACSCCESCLENLKEGDDCTIGLIGAPVPSQVCGPDLTCTKRGEEEHATCQYRTDTTCLRNIQEFSNGIATGSLGHLMERPQCDSLGNFVAIRCIPGQICYCVDKLGQRIFGESLYTTNMALRMNCGCSRQEAILRQSLGLRGSNNFVRCDETGSYARLQCLEEKCICVDPRTGSPTSPQYNRTNLDDLQEDWKCFDENTEILERACEKKREHLSKNTPNYLTSHDLETMCQSDGWFSRVQRNETHHFCADKFGIPIKSYGQAVEGSSLNINCNCARVVDLLRENGRIELPQCCPNGNYNPINCRRGYCYCVDGDGHQITAEVSRKNRSILSCYKESERS